MNNVHQIQARQGSVSSSLARSAPAAPMQAVLRMTINLPGVGPVWAVVSAEVDAGVLSRMTPEQRGEMTRHIRCAVSVVGYELQTIQPLTTLTIEAISL